MDVDTVGAGDDGLWRAGDRRARRRGVDDGDACCTGQHCANPQLASSVGVQTERRECIAMTCLGQRADFDYVKHRARTHNRLTEATLLLPGWLTPLGSRNRPHLGAVNANDLFASLSVPAHYE